MLDYMTLRVRKSLGLFMRSISNHNKNLKSFDNNNNNMTVIRDSQKII